MLVKNLSSQFCFATSLSLCLLLFYQCNPTTCNLPAPTLNTSNITATTAKVSWQTLNTALADDYQVELLDANTNNVISTTFTSNTEFSFTNLSSNKTYLVRVTPRCDVNTASSNQGSVNFTTQSSSLTCNLPATTKINIVPTSATTAKLTWEPVQTAQSYRLTVFDSTANTTRVFNIPPPPTKNLDSLVAGHKYTIKVAAICANGEISPNSLIRSYQPFIIEDNVLMFNGKTLAENCALKDPTSTISIEGQSIFYAPFINYGSMPDEGSNFLIRATNGSSSEDIRITCGKFGNKILVSGGLNCTDYTLPDLSGNVLSKTLASTSDKLEVHLFYDHFEVFFTGIGTAVTYTRNP